MLSPTKEAKKAEEAILSIMTACGFHDLMGQEVTKIRANLYDRVLAKRLKGVGRGHGEVAARKSKSKLTLEGPGHPGTSQASIDALFTEN